MEARLQRPSPAFVLAVLDVGICFVDLSCPEETPEIQRLFCTCLIKELSPTFCPPLTKHFLVTNNHLSMTAFPPQRHSLLKPCFIQPLHGSAYEILKHHQF